MRSTGYYFIGVLLTIVVWRIQDMLPRLLQDEFHNAVMYVLVSWMALIIIWKNNSSNYYYEYALQKKEDQESLNESLEEEDARLKKKLGLVNKELEGLVEMVEKMSHRNKMRMDSKARRISTQYHPHMAERIQELRKEKKIIQARRKEIADEFNSVKSSGTLVEGAPKEK